MDIENILVTTMVSNGRLKARLETAQDDNAILTQAISDLQCSTTINSFFNTAKEKQHYKFLVEIYRDEVQKSLKSDESMLEYSYSS
uniref:Group-specific protein n=1 Tax=Strongyloides venezuelensis TaxID=75913 RepID=A0A0K0F359_STRVS